MIYLILTFLIFVCLLLGISLKFGWLFCIYIFIIIHVYKNKRCINHFEIIDLPFVPKSIVNFLQDGMYFKWKLAFENNLFDDGIINKIRNLGFKHIYALGAGGGGPEPFIVSKIDDCKVTLTDIKPNIRRYNAIQKEFGKEKVAYIEKSVDILNLPNDLNGLLSICATLHHFPKDMVRDIFQHFINHKYPFFILDGKPSIRTVLLLPLRGFCFCLVGNIYYGLKNFNLLQILLTITLILPIIMIHDTIVSSFRFYSRKQLKDIIESIPGKETYSWDYSLAEDQVDMIMIIGEPINKKTNNISKI